MIRPNMRTSVINNKDFLGYAGKYYDNVSYVNSRCISTIGSRWLIDIDHLHTLADFAASYFIVGLSGVGYISTTVRVI
jgi:hypothetical protein